MRSHGDAGLGIRLVAIGLGVLHLARLFICRLLLLLLAGVSLSPMVRSLVIKRGLLLSRRLRIIFLLSDSLLLFGLDIARFLRIHLVDSHFLLLLIRVDRMVLCTDLARRTLFNTGSHRLLGSFETSRLFEWLYLWHLFVIVWTRWLLGRRTIIAINAASLARRLDVRHIDVGLLEIIRLSVR